MAGLRAAGELQRPGRFDEVGLPQLLEDLPLLGLLLTGPLDRRQLRGVGHRAEQAAAGAEEQRDRPAARGNPHAREPTISAWGGSGC